MDFARFAIARALTEQDLGPLIARKVTPEMLPDDASKEVLTFLYQFHGTYNKVPTAQTIQAQFPNYGLPYAPEPLAFYVDAILAQFARADAARFLLSNAASLNRPGDPWKVLTDFHEYMAKLTTLSHQSEDVDFTLELDKLYADYEKLEANTGLTGIKTPWETLDDITQGWQLEEYAVIAGRPKTGKTHLMLRIAMAAEAAGAKVAFFNMEMKTIRMLARLAAHRFKLPYERFRSGQLTDTEKRHFQEGIAEVKAAGPGRLRFIREVTNLAEVRAKVNEYKPDIVLIDGAYLMDEGKGGKEWEQQKAISRGVKKSVTKTGLPWIISSQLNRGGDKVKNKGMEPTLSDLAGSDAFGQDADYILAAEQTFDQRLSNEMTIIPLGVREGAPDKFYINADFEKMDFSQKFKTPAMTTTNASAADASAVDGNAVFED